MESTVDFLEIQYDSSVFSAKIEVILRFADTFNPA
jgi:hypothetical protein